MELSITWAFGGSRPVEIGPATALPREFTASFTFPKDHTFEMDIAVEHTTPVCNQLRVIRNPERGPLTGTELRRVPLASWLELVCREAALRVEEASPGGVAMSPASAEEQVAAARASRRHRNAMTDELLREVANAHQSRDPETDARSPVEVVRDAFHVSPSTAHRYVSLARKRGFLPPKED